MGWRTCGGSGVIGMSPVDRIRDLVAFYPSRVDAIEEHAADPASFRKAL